MSPAHDIDWNDLVHEHAAGVINAAMRVLGNVADAEDVAQEAFVEAMKRWSAGTNQRWKGLLRRMAVCRALDRLRRMRSTDRLPPASIDPLAIDPL